MFAIREAEPIASYIGGLSETPNLSEVVAPPTRYCLERMKDYLRGRYHGAVPVISRRDGHGITYDYFPATEQPASLLGIGSAQPPPSGFLGLGKVGLQLKAPERDVAGLVGIRRVELVDVIRAGGPDRLRDKRHRRPRSLLRATDPESVANGESDHRYAEAFYSGSIQGAGAFLNIWRPTIEAGQTFSLSQLWCVAQGPQGTQTVEIGWHVDPMVTGHADPAIFTFWTGDGYATSNLNDYDGRDGRLHLQSTAPPIGSAITDVSQSGGDQQEVFVGAFRTVDGWWLYVGGDQQENAIGYYPLDLWNGGPLATAATQAQFGGEVCGGPPFAPMGSGAFADAGYQNASYQRGLCVQDANGQLIERIPLQPNASISSLYTVSPGESDDSWGAYLFFGGPGG